MDNPSLVTALAPAFAAGFAVQRSIEILDPLLNRIIGEQNKRIVLGLLSLAIGLGLAYGLDLHVLSYLGVTTSRWLTYIDFPVTGLIISAGTEGFNSILKFLNYKKEETKATALTNALTATNTESRMNMEGAMTEPVATTAEGDDVLMSWQCDSIAYDCVRKITMTTRPFNRSESLQTYGVNSDQHCEAIASLIVGDSQVGVKRYEFKMDIDAVKDLSPGWTMGQLSNRIQTNAEPANLG